MKIKLVTNALYRHEPEYLFLTDAIKRSYCEKWSIEFVRKKDNVHQYLHSRWQKPAVILNELGKCDWVVWMDADAAPVGFDFNLEGFLSKIEEDKVVIAKDKNNFNNGVLAVPNRPNSRKWLEYIESLRDLPKYQKGWYEQQAMIDSFCGDWKEIVFEPSDEIGWNNYPKECRPGKNVFFDGAWCLHTPHLPDETRVKVFKPYASELVGGYYAGKCIEVATQGHLGDAICLSTVLANASAAMPNTKFWYDGAYADIYEHTPFVKPDSARPDLRFHVKYGLFGSTEATASAGPLADGLTLAFSRQLGIEIPVRHRIPQLAITEDERNWAKEVLGTGKRVLINTNCQTKSSVKAYPWWGEVVLALKDCRFFLTGGRETRDIRDNSKFPENVTDLRGKTTNRELLSLAAECSLVVSPPSSICHAAAAFGTPMVIVSGAREPVELTAYPTATHVASVCPVIPGRHSFRYDESHGCMHFVTTDSRSCEQPVVIAGRPFAACMVCINPRTIADEIKRRLEN